MSEKSNIIKLKNLVEDWEGEYERSIKEKPERKDRFNNLSWTEIKPLYTLCDLEDVDYEEDIGLPGRYPYTRGVHTSMYRSRPWTVRQVMGFGGGQESSKRSDFLQKHGQTGFNVVFDHPTNLGLDSDDENADGFVGREGTAIDTIHDMRELLDDINMESESISLVSAHPAILAMVVAIALERGINIENLSGTLQNYPMIGHTMGGCTDASPHYSKRFCLDIVEYCSRNLPRWNSTSVASGQSRAAGCTAVQEIAFGIGSALAIIKGCMERGIGVDEIAPRVSFLLIADRDIFEEVAKFRAMRRLWARILKEEMGAKNPKSCQLRFHCHTAGHALTYQQPMINIVRSTIHGLSAVLGGCQSLHISSADEGFAIPTEESAKLSLRTQQIILDESGAADT
ncbi:MAG: methylmalonyl-CoA mutase family protein, partial [Spirochaetota bacterium]|nr:methylmalonyl-CoA mutase family protein [Spirochaetota bacterium]